MGAGRIMSLANEYRHLYGHECLHQLKWGKIVEKLSHIPWIQKQRGNWRVLPSEPLESSTASLPLPNAPFSASTPLPEGMLLISLPSPIMCAVILFLRQLMTCKNLKDVIIQENLQEVHKSAAFAI